MCGVVVYCRCPFLATIADKPTDGEGCLLRGLGSCVDYCCQYDFYCFSHIKRDKKGERNLRTCCAPRLHQTIHSDEGLYTNALDSSCACLRWATPTKGGSALYLFNVTWRKSRERDLAVVACWPASGMSRCIEKSS